MERDVNLKAVLLLATEHLIDVETLAKKAEVLGDPSLETVATIHARVQVVRSMLETLMWREEDDGQRG